MPGQGWGHTLKATGSKMSRRKYLQVSLGGHSTCVAALVWNEGSLVSGQGCRDEQGPGV